MSPECPGGLGRDSEAGCVRPIVQSRFRLMRRHGIHFFLTFFAGGLVALLVGGVAGSLAATRYADLALFTSVFDLVRQHYFAPIKDGRLLHGAVRGLIQQLDPHSSFLEADAFEETRVDTRGEFYGLGIEITKRSGGLIEVIAPIEGAPAALHTRAEERGIPHTREQLGSTPGTRRVKD